ncbi:hypothetical protein [Lysobacter gummosus]|uniref:Secreted protein n=1 Tax=Lysobacter gummosus TaxID=262324 RepID=A0ABY3XE15_9GAMM|nr:hypothetical protein [Lysobacter gummosus]UNP29917.1 hypothetical protein MOV92_01120 [Lysobacter gummosus]
MNFMVVVLGLAATAASRRDAARRLIRTTNGSAPNRHGRRKVRERRVHDRDPKAAAAAASGPASPATWGKSCERA